MRVVIDTNILVRALLKPDGSVAQTGDRGPGVDSLSSLDHNASMQKTEVYKWRLSPRLKRELQEVARAEQKSMAELLEEIAREWLERFRDRTEDKERQRVLHEAAMKFVGSICGDDPNRAENARSEVRARIALRHAQKVARRRSPSTGLLVSTDPNLGEEFELFKKPKR